MVDVNADLYELAYGTTPSVKTASNLNRGRRRVLFDTFVTGAADGDDVLFGKLATGAVIHDFRVIHEDLGAGTSLQIIARTDNVAQDEIVVCEPFITVSEGVAIPIALDLLHLPAAMNPAGDPYNGERTVLLRVSGGAVTGIVKIWLEYTVD